MHIIKGHFRDESGMLQVGTLMVDMLNSGLFFEVETGFRLEAKRYAITKEYEGVEITSPDAVWEFLPDDGELDRIGMPIQ